MKPRTACTKMFACYTSVCQLINFININLFHYLSSKRFYIHEKLGGGDEGEARVRLGNTFRLRSFYFKAFITMPGSLMWTGISLQVFFFQWVRICLSETINLMHKFALAVGFTWETMYFRLCSFYFSSDNHYYQSWKPCQFPTISKYYGLTRGRTIITF